MPTTRSSEKSTEAKANGFSDQSVGAKHEIEETNSPAAKRVKKDDDKTQKTIEETMPDADGGDHDAMKTDDANTNDDAKNGEGDTNEKKPEAELTQEEEKKEEEKKEEEIDDKENEKPTTSQQPAKSEENGASAVEPEAREGEVPSSILEKGIVYFFIRGRVGIDDPSGVPDIARTYLVLRPMAHDAKLGEGPIGDAGNSRLLAIPKKVLPLSGSDKWIAFVEKVDASFATLKEEFLKSNDYETKTAGTRHSPAATPVGEGVYVVTSTGRESHFAYMLTLPQELGEAQKEIGLREKGSFVLSTRNPAYPPPKYAQLPEEPDYPQEVKDDFRSLRWTGTTPKHLDYVNAQVLLIGEGSGSVEKATEPQKQDQKDGKEEPEEELVKLEEEDAKRMKELSENDSKAIFADLGASAKDYPKLQTTF